MRTRWILLISFLILGGVALFEYWSSIQFPTKEYVPKPLQPLDIGSIKEYDYLIEDETVGYYRFWIDAASSYNVNTSVKIENETVYFVRSKTFVEHHGTRVILDAIFFFNEYFKPLEYRLNASLGEEFQNITCVFKDWSVDGKLIVENRTVDETLELPENTVLIDNFMLAHWYLFLKSFDFELGSRVKFDVYVPQILSYQSIELVIDKKTKNIIVDETSYESIVIRVPEFNLIFYLHEDEIIRMEETQQNVVISISKF